MGDLRRLLQMYARWQRRLFPHCGFDDFIDRVEKLGASLKARACARIWGGGARAAQPPGCGGSQRRAFGGAWRLNPPALSANS